MDERERLVRKMELKEQSGMDSTPELSALLEQIIEGTNESEEARLDEALDHMDETVSEITCEPWADTGLARYSQTCKAIKKTIEQLTVPLDDDKLTLVGDLACMLSELHGDLFLEDEFEEEMEDLIPAAETVASVNIDMENPEQFLAWKNYWERFMDVGMEAVRELDRKTVYCHGNYMALLILELDGLRNEE